MTDLPRAQISHLTDGRVRLRISERRGDPAYFDRVADRLSDWGSVDRVTVNPLTGSVLVFFTDLAALFTENASKNDLFSVALEELEKAAGGEEPGVADRAAKAFALADTVVGRWSGGAAGLRGVVVCALLAGSLYQLVRGRVGAPAATLLWYASETLRLREKMPIPGEPASQPGED